MRDAVIMPVFNEARAIGAVLDAVRSYHDGEVVVIDDGSTDDTPGILESRKDVSVIRMTENHGYGAALRCGFEWARGVGLERLVTMDCDGQHEPAHIPQFLAALDSGGDVISGSRYLPESGVVGATPKQRRLVNARVTKEMNRLTGWGLTDAFCGFKAYRMAALVGIDITEPGYAMPMEFWAKAYLAGLDIRELAVERIYHDYDRSFGADLDDPEKRLAYYLNVWHATIREGS